MKKRPTDNKSQSSASEQRNYKPEPKQLSFLPPAELIASWPAADTLPAEVHARLLTGERLTQPGFGTHRWRLAAYVKALGYLGWPVRSTPVHFPGRARPIAEYWYDPATIAAARSMRGGAA
ncbi:hypothetical protein [Ralstonia solanacearum]|uniref:hypothetical protein n=1 Tax=Ralstonia solanacearum TaxID=305 RepID=UPI0009BC52B1|nr:hypothetical protein [Ralstonia solanacearum]MDC6177813.1 hypothetical protein [Ralstonia solanacearum]MDC6238125.1 hypothetical protein [Ralstonia solanacearum]